MEFTFRITEYDDISFKSQVSKALETGTQLVSRNKYPKIWGLTDKINKNTNKRQKVSDGVVRKRYIRYKIYGIFLVFIGLFLIIPSLMGVKEMIGPLLLGVFATGMGVLYLRIARKPQKSKLSSFDKAASILFEEYVKESVIGAPIIFTKEKI